MALICFLLLTAAVSTMILSASQNIDEALKIARAKLSTNMAFLKTSQSSKGTSNNKPLSNGTSHPASSSSAGVAPRVNQGSFESTAKGMLSSRKKQKIAKVLDRPKDKGEIIPEATISAEKLPYLRHRLRAKLAFWATFVKSTLVLQWLSTGYDLRWTDTEPNSAFSQIMLLLENTLPTSHPIYWIYYNKVVSTRLINHLFTCVPQSGWSSKRGRNG